MTEDIFADKLAKKIATSLQPHKVARKQSLLYELSVDDHGVLSKGIDPATGKPIRGGGHGFEQDILVFDQAAGGHTSVVPRIVAEVKFGSVTTHDVIVYAEKADRIRRVYPYLRATALFSAECPISQAGCFVWDNTSTSSPHSARTFGLTSYAGSAR